VSPPIASYTAYSKLHNSTETLQPHRHNRNVYRTYLLILPNLVAGQAEPLQLDVAPKRIEGARELVVSDSEPLRGVGSKCAR
jgi:hypothetical protein